MKQEQVCVLGFTAILVGILIEWTGLGFDAALHALEITFSMRADSLPGHVSSDDWTGDLRGLRVSSKGVSESLPSLNTSANRIDPDLKPY